jgi:outer membrane murein-binding lipoprotein Lpp
MSNFIKLPGGALGANIEQMQTLSSHLRTSVEQLETVFKGIDSKIGATTWSGTDADRAASQWDQTHSSTMNSLRSMLESLSQAIKSQADQQTATSQG